jgi:hypothetical protein
LKVGGHRDRALHDDCIDPPHRRRDLLAGFLRPGTRLLDLELGLPTGKTGSSLGKSLLKFTVVGERTWQPIGFGQSVMRQFAHIIDYFLC